MRKNLFLVLLIITILSGSVFAINLGDFANIGDEYTYAKDNVKITEVYANPVGKDNLYEYFEITNFGNKRVVIRCGKGNNDWGWSNLHAEDGLSPDGKELRIFGNYGNCQDITLNPGESLVLTRNPGALRTRFPETKNCKVVQYRKNDLTLNNKGGLWRAHYGSKDPVGERITLYSQRNMANSFTVDSVYFLLGNDDSYQSLHIAKDGTQTFADPTPCQAAQPCPDNDGDGHKDATCGGTDCNDNDPNLWQLLSGYIDNDNDAYGVGSLVQVCSGMTLPEGYANVAGDCDDTREWINPGVKLDIPGDEFDANCDGVIECNPNDYNRFFPKLKKHKDEEEDDDKEKEDKKKDKKDDKKKNDKKKDKEDDKEKEDKSNHGQYVKCVTKALKPLYKSGLIDKKQRKEILTAAAKSDVGKINKITGKAILGEDSQVVWLGLISFFSIVGLVLVSITSMNKLAELKKKRK
ncbi:hypothetical protein D6777_03440 [Candidatus Woesearchaeota archaeon]|nr:MAG: hypothetical protein D6777_03440 [Candidatus Woesearchaeota archaeon]